MEYARRLAPGQRCRVIVADTLRGTRETIHESSSLLLEAPNWTHDDQLVLNGDGVLWMLALEPGSTPRQIPLAGIPELNNDHVLAPDGTTIYLSANDWQIYAASLSGGAARRITPDHDGRMHFLHGVSPDGATLAYIGIDPGGDVPWASASVHLMAVDGTADRRIDEAGSPADGSEFSPDGSWIYFNTELFSSAPGHAQLARMRPTGSGVEQLTFDARVNWFPHLSPDGRRLVYLSFPTGTEGHPADLPVELRLVRDDDWRSTETVASLIGGQGTLNVNSWSPDGTRFAYVDYPRDRGSV